MKLVRPAFRDPGGKARLEQLRIDPVHHRTQPIDARNAEVELGKLPQERQMRPAPIDNVIIVIAVRNRPANHQEQHLAERIGDLPGLSRILDLSEVIEQQTQPRLG
jgi:hypothetical protein